MYEIDGGFVFSIPDIPCGVMNGVRIDKALYKGSESHIRRPTDEVQGSMVCKVESIGCVFFLESFVHAICNL